MNTVRQANGEIVTGKVWRQQHFYFHRLPFYSNIPRMDEMVVPLKMALAKVSGHERFCALLLKLGQGLDDVHPFSYTEGVDKLMCDAEKILSPDSASVSAKNASQIWAFMSKFVMVDRLARTLGVAEVYGGNSVPRQPLSREEFAGASYLLDEMNPPTKIVQKFLKTWGNRDQNRSQYSKSSQASGLKDSNEDAAGVALTLSRRLIGIVRVKHVLNIEAGLEMMALGITLSSENSGVFPETVKEVDAVLRRIWSNRLEDEQLQEISQQMQLLHSSIKNIMEYVFATSPLLALSTNSWKRRISGAHLLTLFNALGNNRPSILIRLEDQVLQAIVGISEGKPRTEMMDELYSQIGSLEKDLADDEDAMNWFNFTTAASISSTPAASDIRSTPLPDDSEIPPTLHEKFKGGLASPPESPQVAWSSHHALALKPISSPQPIHKSLDVPVVSSSPTSSSIEMPRKTPILCSKRVNYYTLMGRVYRYDEEKPFFFKIVTQDDQQASTKRAGGAFREGGRIYYFKLAVLEGSKRHDFQLSCKRGSTLPSNQAVQWIVGKGWRWRGDIFVTRIGKREPQDLVNMGGRDAGRVDFAVKKFLSAIEQNSILEAPREFYFRRW